MMNEYLPYNCKNVTLTSKNVTDIIPGYVVRDVEPGGRRSEVEDRRDAAARRRHGHGRRGGRECRCSRSGGRRTLLRKERRCRHKGGLGRGSGGSGAFGLHGGTARLRRHPARLKGSALLGGERRRGRHDRGRSR